MTPSFRARAATAARLLELLVFPSSCRLCGRPLEEPGERILCRECLGTLKAEEAPRCPVCGRFFEGEVEGHLCARCLERPPAFRRHRSCGRYAGGLKEAILIFKYGRQAPLSRPLAAFMETSLGRDEDLWRDVDGLVPVPLHSRRKRERGFNQALLLARDLARLRGLRVLDGCLVRVGAGPVQAGLRAAEREANVRGIYAVRKARKVRDRVLVLVDDVFTTGATLRECARVLVEAGAREVRAITLAQA